LGGDLLVAVLVVLDLVDVDGFLFTILDAGDHTADAGFTDGARAKAGGVGQQSAEELDRHDLLALEFHFINARHAHITQHFEVLEVAVAKTYPELGFFRVVRSLIHYPAPPG